MRWRMRNNYRPGPIKLTATGKEPLYLIIDKNGEFETEGHVDFPLYAFAERIKHTLAPE